MTKKLIILLFLILLTACPSRKGPKIPTAEAPYEGLGYEELIDGQKHKKLAVGLLLPLTTNGKPQKIGESMLKSAQLSMFNSRYNNIILMPYDTKGTEFGAIEAINSAIRDGVDIIVGPYTYAATKAIINIADMNNLMVLSLSDNQALIDNRHSNIYLMGMTTKQEIYRIISYLIDYQNFYGFSGMFPNDAYGSRALKDFKEVIFRKDAKIVKTDFYSRNDPKLHARVNNVLNSNIFREEVYKKYEEEQALAKAEGLNIEVEFTYTDEDKIFADALLLPDSGNDLVRIGEYVATYQGNKKPLLIGTSRWLNSPLYNNRDFNGSLFVSPNPNNYIDFENMYYDAYGNYPIRISSVAYDAITAITEAYARAGKKENLQRALEYYKGFDGINGKFRLLNTGLLERKLAIIRINNGRFEIIDYDDEPFLKY